MEGGLLCSVESLTQFVLDGAHNARGQMPVSHHQADHHDNFCEFVRWSRNLELLRDIRRERSDYRLLPSSERIERLSQDVFVRIRSICCRLRGSTRKKASIGFPGTLIRRYFVRTWCHDTSPYVSSHRVHATARGYTTFGRICQVSERQRRQSPVGLVIHSFIHTFIHSFFKFFWDKILSLYIQI